MPLAGDADGDGRADLIYLWPLSDGIIDISRTSALGKPIYSNAARKDFGKDGLVDASGPFVRKNAADFMGVFADGSVRIAWGMPSGTNKYEHDDLAATIPLASIPKFPVRSAVADFDGDGKADVLLVDAEGKLLLLINVSDKTPKFEPHPLATRLQNVRQFAAGILGSAPKGQCVWLDGNGAVNRATVGLTDLGTPAVVIKTSPEEHMVVGRFRGEKASDILVGQQLLPGGEPTPIIMPDLPRLDEAKGDGPWFASDIDGNGRDDLIRYRRAKERFSGEDTYVHFSYREGEDKGYFCSTNDGLPDVWKTGKIKPGGLDLVALGCKVGHRDILLELECFEDVNEVELKQHMERATKYFASLPIHNPDGTSGIALHVMYQKPWPKSEHDRLMGNFDGNFPPMDHRGIVHTMFAENNGPLVSKVNGDNGHFNGHWAEFLHEFGHQLDLVHDGFWGSTNYALYPSLMSYTYSYSLGDKGEAIGYSDGSLASYVADEMSLSEVLPFPIDKVRFLSGAPYHFHIKSSFDGRNTLVDWNWNGVYGEGNVVADVNYSHGMNMGREYYLGKTQNAPTLVAQSQGKAKLMLIFAKGTKLVARTWLGTNRDSEGNRWSEDRVVDDAGVLGDPTGAENAGATWVSYPTAQGVVLRQISQDSDGNPVIGEARLVPETAGAQATLASFDNRLALFLWRGKDEPIGLRLIRGEASGITSQSEIPLVVKSEVPVGAVAGPLTGKGASIWFSRLEGQGQNRAHTEAILLTLGPDRILRQAVRVWMDGLYSGHRMALLWQKEQGLGIMGRLYHFGGGVTTKDRSYAEQYITMNVPYGDVGQAWLSRRYFEPSFTSSSAPAACFFDGNIVYALRRYFDNPNDNDSIGLFFYGNGAGPRKMGDFDDIGHIRDFGLSHSIKEVAK